VLFVIDRRPYQAASSSGRSGEVGRREPEAGGYRGQANEPLVKNGATTQSEFDKLVAARDVSAATIEAAKAFRDNAS